MYSGNTLRENVWNKLVMAVALVVVCGLVVLAIGAQASSDEMPPPPKIDERNQNDISTLTPPPVVRGGEEQISPSLPQAPPPPGGVAVAAPSPPPPPVPSGEQLREEAVRELWHAYREYNYTMMLVVYASSKSVSISSANEFLKLAVQFYNKALDNYKSNEYMECRAYARLALEALHGAREIIVYELVLRGYPPPLQPLPPLP